MRSAPTLRASVLALALALAALAGCGHDSSTTVVSSPDTFDPVIRRALVESNVTPIIRPAPEDAPVVELGENLFNDPILSGNRNIACASCHQAEGGLSDGVPVALGQGASGKVPDRQRGTGNLIARNAPALFNAGLAVQTAMFHDGRVERSPATGILRTPAAVLNIPVPFPPSTTAEKIAAQLTSALAAQAMFPVLDRSEMRGVSGTAGNELGDVPDDDLLEGWRRIMVRLIGQETSPGSGVMEPANPTQTAYRALFQAAFPATALPDLNFGHAARAIAAYQREDFSSTGSPWDRYVEGQSDALTDEQKRGALIFYGKTKKGKCSLCHTGPLLSDFKDHALAIPQVGPGSPVTGVDDPLEDRGRAKVSGDAADNYKFRTPSLRNVARSGPYFHDGAYPTLRDVMIHYNDIEGGIRTYEQAYLPLIDPALGVPYDGDPGRIDARVAASQNDALLPQKLGLTEREISDLVAFMGALTDETFDDPPLASVPSGLPVGGD